ncbi:beta-1,6-N-acetylglucosaminyltransferase [Sulfurovum sp.]|uniref:beta-1,6-N-acetylglucosaminyltransferase n=1 Tax=Sulfurovum sp. TaxID=1969726 RepID=UPI0025F406E3|nr:beta-1,6-N-acetylglucosaminyltransferase [Sulfurovum sp.]
MTNNEMTIAFLLLAHHQPEHTGRLVRMLDDPRHHFFIHVDKQTDLSWFRKKATVKGENVHFLTDRNRFKINWGGFNMLKATLRLVETAWQSPLQFGRFCLLSGSDYLLKSQADMRTALAEDIEYIRIDRMLSDHQSDTHSHNIEHFFFPDNPILKSFRLSGRFHRRPYDGIALYHGSQWWALSRRAISFILDFLEKNPAYTQFHRYVNCPDEIFFASMLKSTPFADRISHDFEARQLMDPTLFGAHYIDWCLCSNDGRSPKILTEDDYEKLYRSEALFARKFDEESSAILLQKIDRCLGKY